MGGFHAGKEPCTAVPGVFVEAPILGTLGGLRRASICVGDMEYQNKPGVPAAPSEQTQPRRPWASEGGPPAPASSLQRARLAHNVSRPATDHCTHHREDDPRRKQPLSLSALRLEHEVQMDMMDVQIHDHCGR